MKTCEVKKMYSKKVLIGFPTSDAKYYCITDFIQGLSACGIDKNDIVCIDTSKTRNKLKKEYAGFNYFHTYKQKAMDRVVVARQAVANIGIAYGYERVCFIDSDAILDSKCILELLRHDVDVVSAVLFTIYPNKMIGPAPFVTETEHLNVKQLGTGLIKAYRIGFGTVMIKTDILKRIKIRCDRDKNGFMKVGEDYCFSDDCRNSGIDLWIDTNIQVPHRIVGQWDNITS